jgi:hypothetical protein
MLTIMALARRTARQILNNPGERTGGRDGTDVAGIDRL